MRLFASKSSLLIIVAVALFGLSCKQSWPKDYNVDKTSPNGTYRVKIEIRALEHNGTRDYTDHGRIQFFKGQEVIHIYEWEESDQYEATSRENKPLVEWVADNVLRLGEDISDQPFSDEFIVSNNTDEYVKYMSIGYGKNELFWIFDLEPRKQIVLSASPGFKPDGSSNYFLGYGGTTRSGKEFQGVMDSKQRKSPAEGALKFEVNISVK
jgi:hypothetical protein